MTKAAAGAKPSGFSRHLKKGLMEGMVITREPDAITHPDGMQIKITRQEIAKIVGCSREMAGRVMKTLEEDGLITAHGKTIVVFGTR